MISYSAAGGISLQHVCGRAALVVPDQEHGVVRVEGQAGEVRLAHHFLHAQRRRRVRRHVKHVHLRATLLLAGCDNFDQCFMLFSTHAEVVTAQGV